MLAVLRNRTNIILAVARFEHRMSGTVEQFKAIAILIDGSRLHINEVWLDMNELEGRLLG